MSATTRSLSSPWNLTFTAVNLGYRQRKKEVTTEVTLIVQGKLPI